MEKLTAVEICNTYSDVIYNYAWKNFNTQRNRLLDEITAIREVTSDEANDTDAVSRRLEEIELLTKEWNKFYLGLRPHLFDRIPRSLERQVIDFRKE